MREIGIIYGVMGFVLHPPSPPATFAMLTAIASRNPTMVTILVCTFDGFDRFSGFETIRHSYVIMPRQFVTIRHSYATMPRQQ